MKKAIALLMAILLAAFLFACSDKTDGSDSSSDKTAATTSDAPSTAPSTEPSAVQNTDTSNETNEQSTVGYLTDDVDYLARDAYHVTYIYAVSVPMMTTAKDTLVALGEKMNFSVTQVDANGDMGKYIDAIEQEIGTGTNGFIFAPRVDVVEREDDLCKEAGLPYISIMTPYLDEDGHNLCPTVQFDGIDAGGKLADWVVENYSNYIEGDLSSLGFLVLGFSADQTFINRSDGFMNRIKEINPEYESNIVYVDCIDEGFSIESGYNKAAATLSGHADIKNWIVFGVSEEFNVGACRAIETAGKANDCVVVSTGCDAIFLEWDAGNSPEWIATIPIYGPDIAVASAAGLVALMDGRATLETLWQEVKLPGDIATRYNLSLEIVTKDTYQDFIDGSQAVLDTFNGKNQ